MPNPVTIPGVPYTGDAVAELQFAQSNDYLFIVHHLYKPAALIHNPDTDEITYSKLVIENGPYLDQMVGDDEVTLWVTGTIDRITLTSTNAAEFTGLLAGALVQYPIEDQWALGEIVTPGTASVTIQPLPERSLVLSKETFSPGIYTGWNTTNNKPTYSNPITGSGIDVAFSNSQAVTRQSIGNYIRFCDRDGLYMWILVTAVADILEQGAYGIIATGDIQTVHVPTGYLSRTPRVISATLNSSATDFFSAVRDVDRLYRLNFNDTIIHARCTAVPSGVTATVSLSGPIPLTLEGTATVLQSTTTDWRKGAWYVDNYPGSIAIHEERLIFSGVPSQRQTIYMSKSADFFNFAATDEKNAVQDDSAIVVTVSSSTVNGVQWMTTDTALLLGTCGAEWMVSSGNNRVALTPTNVTASRQSSFGSALIDAISVGRSTFYVQRGGNKMREMNYDYSVDRFVSLDVTVFAEHILREHGGAVELAYAQLPESIIYVRCVDGQIGALTYEPDQKVYSWSRIIIGGPNAQVKSIETKLEGAEDVLYMIVQRGAIRTMEKLVPTYEPASASDFTDMIFMDCYIQVSLSAVDVALVANGLELFANQTVTALIDDVPYDNLVVNSAGQVTLPLQPISRLIVGYAYTSLFESFPLETQGRRGTTQGKIKTINQVTLRCRNTIGFQHGLDAAALTQENIPDPQLHESKDIRVPLPNNYDTRGTYIVAQTKAYPLTILALYPEPALQQ
jgi:hypothetical protein